MVLDTPQDEIASVARWLSMRFVEVAGKESNVI
jgi:hypothetical protein